jgi:hypothetical protein
VDEGRDQGAAGDDGFWDLFQDEERAPLSVPPRQDAGAPMPAERVEQPEVVQIDSFEEYDELDDLEAAVPVMAAAPASATGRLFRSYYVIDPTATPALRPDQARKLRTVRTPIDSEGLDSHHEPVRRGRDADHEPVSRRSSGKRRQGQRSRQGGGGDRGLRGGLGYLVVIAVTVLVSLIEALLTGTAFSWLTGIALVGSTIYIALTLRRADLAVAVIAPPIAALIAALTSGQLGVQGGIVERGLAVFLTLGRNWPWILGAAVIGLTIALVRSRRSGRRGP